MRESLLHEKLSQYRFLMFIINFCISLIFDYGAELQQEIDETL